MSGNNTTTGTFTHSQGMVDFSGEWSGNYDKKEGATLQITGNPVVKGLLILNGGDINMDLTQTPPSKISVYNAVSASGSNTLNIISSEDQTNYVLMQAASGIGSTTPYKVNMPDFEATLAAEDNNKLLLNAIYVGIDEYEASPLHVYPNPTNGELISRICPPAYICCEWMGKW